MEKYKICPVCGIRNDPLYLECLECESDLQNVPVMDAAMERYAEQAASAVPEVCSASSVVRVCDCGAKNPVQARRCSVCGEDISMIVPTPDTVMETVRYVLSALDGGYTYEVCEGTHMIGREHEMREYLGAKPYVSRRHAELSLDASVGKLTIRNCSATNYTFINNRMLSGDVSAELRDGDEIGLGGNEQNGTRQSEAAYFTVRIGTCM